MVIDPSQIPVLYTWIKNNIMAFVLISLGLLSGFGAYQFIDGFMRPYGASVASEHADFRRAVQSYTALDNILQRILREYHASRVALFRFHDNEKDLSRMAFFFASAADIVAAPGITVDADHIINVPASTFEPVLAAMLERKILTVHSDSLPYGPLRELQNRRGTVLSVFISVTDIEGNMIGFLQLDWLSVGDSPQGTAQEAMVKTLIDDANRVSGFFSLPTIPDKNKSFWNKK